MGWGDWGNWGNLPPIAAAGPDQEVTVWQEITFDGSGSYDPDGHIVSWLWYIEQYEPIEGELITFRFDHSHINEVILKVTDNNGQTAIDICTITINPLLLQVKICGRPSPIMEYHGTPP